MSSPEPESTRVLLARAAEGDDTAVESICARYLPALRRWAHGRLPRIAREEIDTEDLVQETLVRTVKRLEHFEPEHSGAFQAYLRRALLNRIRDRMRRLQRRPARVEAPTDLADRQQSPLERAIGAEALARYEAALEALSANEREAVIARLEFGLPYREVADSVGYPSHDAARMAVSRALVKLAEELSGVR